MSYIKEVQEYKASQDYFRKEREIIRFKKLHIISSADYACNSDEQEALKNFLKFIDDKEILSHLQEYYYDLEQEKTADCV